MNQFEFSFSEQEIEDILQEAMKLTAIEIKENTDKNYQSLLIKAHMLYIAYEKQMAVMNIQEILSRPKMPDRLKGKNNSQLSNEDLQAMSNYQLQKARFEKQARYFHYLYPLAFAFDDELTRFRGKVPREAAYVVETKDGLKTYTMSLLELWKLYNPQQSRIFMDEKQMINKQNLQHTYSILEEQLKNKKDDNMSEQDQLFHIKQAEAAYKGVINRLQRFRKMRNQIRRKNYKNLKSSSSLKGSLLLWKNNSEWEAAKIESEGDIKEAYVAMLMADHIDKCLCQINAGQPDYYNDYFIQQFFIKFIMNVTSLAAIVEEDVVARDIQYAVKSIAASLPSIKQYIDTAKYIIDSPGGLNKEEIEQYLNSEYNKPKTILRNSIVDNFSKISNDTIDTVVEIISTNKN